MKQLGIKFVNSQGLLKIIGGQLRMVELSSERLGAQDEGSAAAGIKMHVLAHPVTPSYAGYSAKD